MLKNNVNNKKISNVRYNSIIKARNETIEKVHDQFQKRKATLPVPRTANKSN